MLQEFGLEEGKLKWLPPHNIRVLPLIAILELKLVKWKEIDKSYDLVTIEPESQWLSYMYLTEKRQFVAFVKLVLRFKGRESQVRTKRKGEKTKREE